MKASVKHENFIQGELIEYFGKDLIESLPIDTQMVIYAEWRDIINDWKTHHDGEIPNMEQMKYIMGVWHKMPPTDYIKSLASKGIQ